MKEWTPIISSKIALFLKLLRIEYPLNLLWQTLILKSPKKKFPNQLLFKNKGGNKGKKELVA